MNSVDQIFQDAIHLSEDERLSLVSRLLNFSEPYASDDMENAWNNEIRERIARYDSGDTTSRPASEVFADLDHHLQCLSNDH